MIVRLAPGDQHLAARRVQPELGRGLLALGVEHDGRLDRAVGQRAQPLHDGEGALAQRLGDLAVAGGDRRLHGTSLLAQAGARARDDVVEMSLRVGRGSLPGEAFGEAAGAGAQRATRSGAPASSSIRPASASTSPCGTR